MERYAIYFAPPPESPLGRFGAAWLGRDAFTGEDIEQDPLPEMTSARFAQVTDSPRRYGFHATLKAPFRLAGAKNVPELFAAVDALAARTPAFEAPPLEIASIQEFTAMVLSAASPAMQALAEACVRDLDDFRAPLTDGERARRRPDRLTERQRGYLETWGYPYVFEEFLFHMTLTERLTDEQEKAEIFDVLEPIGSVFGTAPLVVDQLCVFGQPSAQAPFTVVHTARLKP